MAFPRISSSAPAASPCTPPAEAESAAPVVAHGSSSEGERGGGCINWKQEKEVACLLLGFLVGGLFGLGSAVIDALFLAFLVLQFLVIGFLAWWVVQRLFALAC